MNGSNHGNAIVYVEEKGEHTHRGLLRVLLDVTFLMRYLQFTAVLADPQFDLDECVHYAPSTIYATEHLLPQSLLLNVFYTLIVNPVTKLFVSSFQHHFRLNVDVLIPVPVQANRSLFPFDSDPDLVLAAEHTGLTLSPSSQ